MRGLFHLRKKGDLVKRAKPDAKTHKPYRRDIQALRALAVMAVVIYHLWPNRLSGGFTGVDIFFVISGYLMTISIMRRLKPLVDKHSITVKSVSNLLVEFYARRIKRLVPAAIVAILGVLVLAHLTGNLNVIITNAKNAISAATFWQNWFLANDSLNYLQQDNLIVATQHFWSLSVEEQFYLLWPLLLVISTLITINITVLFKKDKIPGVILPITLVTLGSIAYGVWLTKTNSGLAYYSTPARVWELMIGGIIAFLPMIKNYDLKLLIPYLGLVINLFSILYIDANGFPGWWALLPTIGTAMIIWGGTDRYESRLSFDNAFRWRPIQWTGDISYSLYLWHFPLIILLPIILHRDINGPGGMIFKLAIIVLSFVIAYLSYRFIEQSSQRLQLKTRWIYLFFAIATIIVVALSFYIKSIAQDKVQTGLKSMHIAALDESNICFGARAILHQNKCGSPYGVSTSSYNALGSQDVYAKTIAPHSGLLCGSNAISKLNGSGVAQEGAIPKECIVGDTKSAKALVVIGDSHATQYINALDYMGKQQGYKVVLLSELGCYSFWSKQANDVNCRNSYEQAITTISKLRENFPKLNVLVSVLYIKGIRVEDFVKSIHADTGIAPILLNDIPNITGKDFSACNTLKLRCTEKIAARTSQANFTLENVLDKNIRSKMIDLTDAFCHKDMCYSNIGGIPVYYSSTDYATYHNSHITASFSYSMGPFLIDKLQAGGAID